MAYLDLKKLPAELQATLDRHFDNDESKRRAVLAPWVATVCSTVIDQALWAWQPSSRFWRRKWAAEVRKDREEFFAMRVGIAEDAPSMFDPPLPFFPTPLTHVTETITSPWPDVLSDAEYWAFVMQLHDGDKEWAFRRISRWIARLSEAVHPHGLKRLRFWHTKAAVIRNMEYLMHSENVGDYL